MSACSRQGGEEDVSLWEGQGECTWIELIDNVAQCLTFGARLKVLLFKIRVYFTTAIKGIKLAFTDERGCQS